MLIFEYFYITGIQLYTQITSVSSALKTVTLTEEGYDLSATHYTCICKPISELPNFGAILHL